jgi:transcriptional regulator with XRE-family HTH domain
LTQLEVASRAGIARSFYQYVESGAIAGGEPANPSLRVMVALAQALEIEVSGLLPIGLRIDPTQR